MDGVEIVTNATVERILTRPKHTTNPLVEGECHEVTGVQMADGTELHAETVLTGCSPYHTFVELLGSDGSAEGDTQVCALP